MFIKIFAAVFFVIGLLLCLNSLWGLAMNSFSEQWLYTPGKIVGIYPDSQNRFEYEYQVNGHPYRSDRARFGYVSYGGTGRRWGGNRQIGEYVGVYYDPDKPNRAVLSRYSSRDLLFGVFGGAVFMLFAVFMVWDIGRRKSLSSAQHLKQLNAMTAPPPARREWMTRLLDPLEFPLPKEMPNLQEPKFILSNPAILQFVVLLILLSVSLASISWVLYLLNNGQTIDGGHIALLIIMGIMLFAVLHPKMWHRWVVFAADRKGVYFVNANVMGRYTFVPWKAVGDVRLGKTTEGIDVIFKLKVDDATWERIRGKIPTAFGYLQSKKDADGYRQMAIGNAARSAANTLRAIERIRLKASR